MSDLTPEQRADLKAKAEAALEEVRDRAIANHLAEITRLRAALEAAERQVAELRTALARLEHLSGYCYACHGYLSNEAELEVLRMLARRNYETFYEPHIGHEDDCFLVAALASTTTARKARLSVSPPMMSEEETNA